MKGGAREECSDGGPVAGLAGSNGISMKNDSSSKTNTCGVREGKSDAIWFLLVGVHQELS
ncbi:MAG: hypothetical protein KF824_04880 [Fimbriimonadaceae bacterium]|nr:MAG: hypothetical protein KF824_04880 [Fimbriimonadaceae bacterium]